MKKLICAVSLAFAVQTPVIASPECIEVSKMAGLVMASRHKGVSKSELISILRNQRVALEMVDQVFLVEQANDDQEAIEYVKMFMQVWYDECVKINKEIDRRSFS